MLAPKWRRVKRANYARKSAQLDLLRTDFLSYLEEGGCWSGRPAGLVSALIQRDRLSLPSIAWQRQAKAMPASDNRTTNGA